MNILIQQNPQIQTTYERGEHYFKNQNYKKAIEYYAKKISPDNKDNHLLYYRIIQSYLYLNKPQDAFQIYKEFAEECSFDHYTQTYFEIIKFFIYTHNFPTAVKIINLFKTSLPYEFLIEKAKCLLYLNRIKEANSVIEHVLKIIVSYNQEFNVDFISCYFIIKNILEDYKSVINLYNQYRNFLSSFNNLIFKLRIYLELGKAFINLNKKEEMNKEVFKYIQNYLENNIAQYYIAYLNGYYEYINRNYTEAKKHISKIFDNHNEISSLINQRDLSLFCELYGDINIKLNNYSSKIIDIYFYAIHGTCWVIELYIKMTSFYLYSDEQNSFLSNENKLSVFNKFTKELESLYKENNESGNCHNTIKLKCLHLRLLRKINKDNLTEYEVMLFKEIMELLRNENIRNRYTTSELIAIYQSYYYYLPLYHKIKKDELFIYPQSIKTGQYTQMYSGELAKEEVMIKIFKYDKDKVIDKEDKKKLFEIAFMEISTMELIQVYQLNTSSQINSSYKYLLPIKCGFNLNNSKFIYLITPLCKGGSLNKLLSTPHINLTLAEIKKILFSVASGIYVLHCFNMVHNDIKSANVLLKNKYQSGKDLEVYLGGFDYIEGKPIPYDKTNLMYAPELFDNNNNNKKLRYKKEVDIYAFGMLIYEIVMKGTNKYRQDCSDYINYEELKERAGSAMYDLFMKCVSKEPSLRPKIENVIDCLRQYKII